MEMLCEHVISHVHCVRGRRVIPVPAVSVCLCVGIQVFFYVLCLFVCLESDLALKTESDLHENLQCLLSAFQATGEWDNCITVAPRQEIFINLLIT